MSTAPSVRVLDPGLDGDRIRALVRERSTLSRVRVLLGREEPIELERELYWPIALIHATAQGTGRRAWTERVQGAVDLLSGRVGLVDVDLPPVRELPVPPADRIEARLSRSAAQAVWHEFFRDHVDRRYKPMRPPVLSLDRIDRLWLPNHVVSSAGRRFLVDAMVARVEELRNFPSIEQMLRAQQPTMHRRYPCKA